MDASKGLKNKRIECLDFEEVIDSAKNGDLIYCDPTYTVAHTNNGFVKYNEKIFSWADQERLLNCAIRAYNKGVTVIISNAAHKSILELYSPFKPRVLSRMSLISRKIDSRKEVKEYLFVLKPK
jgi:DNA adenine methylase